MKLLLNIVNEKIIHNIIKKIMHPTQESYLTKHKVTLHAQLVAACRYKFSYETLHSKMFLYNLHQSDLITNKNCIYKVTSLGRQKHISIFLILYIIHTPSHRL